MIDNRRFRFRQFQVYKDALVFYNHVKNFADKKFPKSEQYSLTRQLLRASYSVSLNIAEGADRGTDKDFARYLNTAHTSLNEVVACLDLAFTSRYINDRERNEFLEKSEKLVRQLTAFRKRLLEDPSK